MPVPISNLSAVFANSQQTFVGLGLNVSYTAAATGSRLFELKVNNEPKFWIGLNGIPSTNLSTVDSYSRTLAEDAYAIATSTQLSFNESNVYTTIAGANVAVGAGANAFSSATIAGANVAVGAGANTVGIAAFNRANTPNIYIANTNETGTVVYSQERRTINFIDRSSNTGVGIRITDNIAIGAADVNFSIYDTFANNISIPASTTLVSGVNGVVFNQSYFLRPYKRILLQFDEIQFSTTASLRLFVNGINSTAGGSGGTNFTLTNLQPSTNTVTGICFINNISFSGPASRKSVEFRTQAWDGVNIGLVFTSGGTLVMTNPLIYFVLFASAGTFTNGKLTVTAYY